MVEPGVVDSLSYETVGCTWKNTIKPQRRKQWCIPEASADFVARMGDVLDLYAEPYDLKKPVGLELQDGRYWRILYGPLSIGLLDEHAHRVLHTPAEVLPRCPV